jgi:dihydroflavonol-4-reductase
VKTVFLTGGTGFVGSHAATRFLAAGWRVRALVRRPADPGLLPKDAEIVAGALAEERSYRRAMEGCEAVVHAAGLTKALTLAEYRRANASGAAAVARAAAEACPGAMFVLVSSQSAAGPSGRRPVRESDPPRPVSWYGLSKLEGEKAVEELRRGPWCAVRPSVVYGPGDRGLLQLFAAVARGWAPVLAGGMRRIQLIAAEDLALVLFEAASRPDLTGRRGFAAADTVTMGELSTEIARLRKPPARKLPVPAAAVRLAGWMESAREAATGRPRPFNRDKAREILAAGWESEAGPFLSDLGVKDLKPWKQGILETLRWYLREGWIAPCFGEL